MKGTDTPRIAAEICHRSNFSSCHYSSQIFLTVSQKYLVKTQTFLKDFCDHLYICRWGWLKNLMGWKGFLGNENDVGNGFRWQWRHLQSIDNCSRINKKWRRALKWHLGLPQVLIPDLWLCWSHPLVLNRAFTDPVSLSCLWGKEAPDVPLWCARGWALSHRRCSLAWVLILA